MEGVSGPRHQRWWLCAGLAGAGLAALAALAGLALAGCRFDGSGLLLRDRGSGLDRPRLELGPLDLGDGPRPELSPDQRLEGAPPAAWWHSSWKRRRKLTFSNATGAEDLVGVPVLVVLDDKRIDYAAIAGSGDDLRFVDADGVTVLPYEIELWNAKGRSFLWVRVPQIDKGSATDHIWLYYNQPSAPAGEDVSEVWGADFAGVWHLDGSDDSSEHYNHATSRTAPTGPALIGSGLNFDGKAQLMELPTSASLSQLSVLTVEVWMKTKQVWDVPVWPASAALVSRASPGLDSGDWSLLGGRAKEDSGDAGRLIVVLGRATEPSFASGKGKNDDQWHHVVWTRTAGGLNQLYVDGAPDGQLQDDGGKLDASVAIQVGGEAREGGARFNGHLDELRVSSVARTAAWVRAQHQSMRDAGFVSFGVEETL